MLRGGISVMWCCYWGLRCGLRRLSRRLLRLYILFLVSLNYYESEWKLITSRKKRISLIRKSQKTSGCVSSIYGNLTRSFLNNVDPVSVWMNSQVSWIASICSLQMLELCYFSNCSIITVCPKSISNIISRIEECVVRAETRTMESSGANISYDRDLGDDCSSFVY